MEHISEHISIEKPAPYDIFVHRGLLTDCSKLIKEQNIHGKIGIITDQNVASLYLTTVKTALQQGGYQVSDYAIMPGEPHKTWDTLGSILEFLAQNEFTRQDVLIALGGGVVGDIAGMAAGLYMRGISYIQMPTSVLAAVDSSIGGKTAIDLKAGKNLAGLFVQPTMVLCDPDSFQTLPEEEMRSGMAEVIKTALLEGEAVFDLVQQYLDTPLKQRDMSKLIAACLHTKARIVQQDPYEKDIRQCLNFGHTIGHALEKLHGYHISHGQGVAQGMQVMVKASMANHKIPLDPLEGERMLSLIRKLGFSEEIPYSAAEIAREILHDKKRQGEYITFVIPYGIGNCKLVKYPMKQVEEFIAAGM